YIGVISPSSNEVGPFKSIEESMIAHLTPHNKRPEVYAVHSLVGTVGGALGAICCGTFLSFIKSRNFVEDDLQAYKLVFLIYAFIAFLKVIVMLLLSEKTELNGHLHEELSSTEAIINDELAPLIEETEHSNENKNALSKEAKSVLYKLLLVFMIDSLGMGFMTDGWMVYYYSNVFSMSSFALGAVFFTTQFVMASSTLPSSAITKRFGPVKSILMVQIPSAVFEIFIPFCESHLSLSLLFLNLFFATMAMDVTPRQILLTNIIRPSDLTRVMGIVNIGKTFSRCIGPIFTGILASNGLLWSCFIISGFAVILADLILAFFFLKIDSKLLRQLS
ncbi:hypothetical protein Kpol_1008p11, partial [Vanderwaltozyma polyspora DSM 70294]